MVAQDTLGTWLIVLFTFLTMVSAFWVGTLTLRQLRHEYVIAGRDKPITVSTARIPSGHFWPSFNSVNWPMVSDHEGGGLLRAFDCHLFNRSAIEQTVRVVNFKIVWPPRYRGSTLWDADLHIALPPHKGGNIVFFVSGEQWIELSPRCVIRLDLATDSNYRVGRYFVYRLRANVAYTL